MAVDYLDFINQQNQSRPQFSLADVVGKAIALKQQTDAAAQDKQLNDLRMQGEQMRLSEMMRKQKLGEDARNAYATAPPSLRNIANPAYVSPGQYESAVTAGPPEQRNAMLSELMGGAPGQSALVYPGEGADVMAGYKPEPQTIQQQGEPDRFGAMADVYAKGGDVESALGIYNLQDKLAQVKVKGDPLDYYKKEKSMKLYKDYVDEISKLSKTAEGRAQIPALDAAYQKFADPADRELYQSKTLNLTPDGAFQSAPDGGYIWTKTDGTQMHIAPGAVTAATEYTPDGKQERGKLVDRTGKTVAYTSEWHAAKSQVTNVNVHGGGGESVAQTTFVDPATGTPLVFDKKTGTYRVSTIEGGGGATPKPAALSPEAAAKAQLVEQGLTYIPEIRKSVLKPDGSVNREIVAGIATRFPFSEGRKTSTLILDAVEAKLRAESGAAVPEPEVKRAAKRFIPQVADNDATIKLKIDNLEKFLSGTSEKINTGRQSQTAKPVKVGGFTVRVKGQ